MKLKIIKDEIFTFKSGLITLPNWKKQSSWNGMTEYRNDKGEKIILLDDTFGNILEAAMGNPAESGTLISASPSILTKLEKI